jgi:alkanesulfonate monooxygenase
MKRILPAALLLPLSPLLGVPATNGRPASAPGGAPLLIAGGR